MQGTPIKLYLMLSNFGYQYVVPVYQRRYDWKLENCGQLFDDLLTIVKENRPDHFFGSIVSSSLPRPGYQEMQVIDGQQRLTTVSLLLLALSDLLREGKLEAGNGPSLGDEIRAKYLESQWTDPSYKFRLVPGRSDKEAYRKLFEDSENWDLSSNLTINYQYFRSRLLERACTADEMLSAVCRLEVITITLESSDRPQLIFESLNATGLALTEGDKIRNFVLMDLPSDRQELLYSKYWSKIEALTGSDVSPFIRDYLSIKQRTIPKIDRVYSDFKQYVRGETRSLEEILGEMLQYARHFNTLATAKSGLGSQILDDCMYRLNRLEFTVTRPFFLEVLSLQKSGKIEVSDVERVFLVTESYLFRRSICELSTSALNKIFLTLNSEVLRLDNGTAGYAERFIYVLLHKQDSGRFPDDTEFSTALSERQVYKMRSSFKTYLFERFENQNLKEIKDVYTLLDNGTYSIEHIMPQHMDTDWYRSLRMDENPSEIHAVWLHRLANLTLTAYNGPLSNRSFEEKRDDPDCGYRNSGLRMNNWIAQQDRWGLHQLEERSREMTEQALKIWPFPSTTFLPPVTEYDTCTLADESFSLTGCLLVKFSYEGFESPASSWVDMFEQVVKSLHSKDPSILTGLVYGNIQDSFLSNYVAGTANQLRKAIEISAGIYVERNTSTALKLSLLRRLFKLYGEDPSDLEFFFKQPLDDSVLEEIRKRYWKSALPVIKQAGADSGIFANSIPVAASTISSTIRITGYKIHCILNQSGAKVALFLASKNMAQNKKDFALLQQHASQLQEGMPAELVWDSGTDTKPCQINCSLADASYLEENNWDQITQFFAETSSLLVRKVLSFLKH